MQNLLFLKNHAEFVAGNAFSAVFPAVSFRAEPCTLAQVAPPPRLRLTGEMQPGIIRQKKPQTA